MSWFIGLTAFLPFIIFIVAVLFGIFLARKLLAKFPKFVIKQSYRNAFFTGLIVLPIYGIVWLIIIFGFGQSVENGFLLAILICSSAIIPWYLFILVRNTKKAGKVVLDIMAFPNRNICFVGIGTGLLMIFSGGLQSMFMHTGKISDLLPIFFGLYQIVFHSLLGLSRLQIREKGFWIYGDLLTWERIESLNWDYDGGRFFALKLVIAGKTPAFLRNGVMIVPIRKKHHLENLIQVHLPHIVS